MNLHKLLFPRKEKLIEELYELTDELRANKKMLEERALFLGHIAVDLPFIPTDFGFSVATVQDVNVGEIDVYSRDGWHLSRTPAFDKNEWKVINYDKKINHEVILDNMRDAVIVLYGLGMDIRRDSITNELDAIKEEL